MYVLLELLCGGCIVCDDGCDEFVVCIVCECDCFVIGVE